MEPKEGSVFPSQISWEELATAERDELLAIDRPFNPKRSGFSVTLQGDEITQTHRVLRSKAKGPLLGSMITLAEAQSFAANPLRSCEGASRTNAELPDKKLEPRLGGVEFQSQG